MNTTDCEKIEEKLSKSCESSGKCVEELLVYGNEELSSKKDNNNIIIEQPITPTTPTHNESYHLEVVKDFCSSSIFEGSNPSDSNGMDSPQPLERWSPLGADYDDEATSPSSELSRELSQKFSRSNSQDNAESVCDEFTELARIRSMEEEQELLTSSLLALTSHFAHVQLRVRQIVEAPSNEREQLLKDLKDLEEFAFQGIPEPIDVTASKYSSAPQQILLEKQKIIIDELKNKLNLKVEDHDLPELSPEELKNQVENAIGEFVGPLKMKEQLVTQLKTQIADLERFIVFLQCDSDDSKLKTLNGCEKFHEAYNSYSAKKKKRSGERIQKKSENAKLKVRSDEIIANQSHDVVDNVSQREEQISLNSKAHGLIDKASLLMQMFATSHFGSKADHFQKNTLKKTAKGDHWGDLRAQLEIDIQEVAALATTLSFDREKLHNLRRAIKKASNKGLQSVSGCKGTISKVSPRNIRNSHVDTEPKKTHQELKHCMASSDSDDDAYECYDWDKSSQRFVRNLRGQNDSIGVLHKELTAAVRKNFAITLQKLIQHGLRVETESAASSLIVPFMRCLHPSPVLAAQHNQNAKSFSVSSFGTSSYYGPYNVQEDTDENSESGFLWFGGSRQMHAWELILEYYYLKQGDEYNNTPARKLSESFNLDIIDSRAVTVKQSLLSVIGDIIALHRPYKRSYNAHFKAFICAALNSHQLVEWLNLILSCTDLVDMYYTPNSYFARTGFRDTLRSIDVLSNYEFDLPVDLAVRHLKNV